jgi:hypothetical protein
VETASTSSRLSEHGDGRQGKNPIAGWKISGTKTVKKVYDKSVKSYVYCCVGGPTNKMQLPNDAQTSACLAPALPLSHSFSHCGGSASMLTRTATGRTPRFSGGSTSHAPSPPPAAHPLSLSA